MSAAIDFDEVAAALAGGGSAVHAAEAHGCLVGALCTRRAYPVTEWLEELLPDAQAAATLDTAPLEALYQRSRAVLQAPDMEFEPLLPADDAPLATRVEALGAWAQGFLYGFGAAGPLPRGALSGDVAEVLADFAEIARAGAVGSESAEAEEAALAELIEFMRVGAQLLYDDLDELRASQAASALRH